MRTLRQSLVFLLVSVLAAGCAVSVPMNAKAPTLARAEVKLPLRVALLVEADAQAREAPGSSMRLVYPVGEALEKTAPPALAPLFAGVEKVRALHPFPAGFDGGVHIMVDEASIVFIHPSAFYTSTILLKCLVYDRKGEIVTTLHSRGYARGLSESRLTGNGILGRIADQALERALGALLAKLIEDNEVERLSRK